ncbi:MAG: hypothetical protein HPY71_14565 [Firmicutes bacterium]|nr:hypothetical protein [Bacillota bacterium]
MIEAELRGKLSRGIERSEDVLTSNVFSFLKYSDRGKCLRAYLEEALGLKVSEREAEEAEFRFWPSYDGGTEPDVVIIVGGYYLLFEAKYLSGFGAGDEVRDPQAEREARLGLKEAISLGKEFFFIPITADFYFKGDKGFVLTEKMMRYLKPTSWQRFAAFLENLLESGTLTSRNEIEFAEDLHELLDRKNLRGFYGYAILAGAKATLPEAEFLFYDARGSTFRGAFIGFAKTLATAERIDAPKRHLFMAERKMFRGLLRTPEIMELGDRRLFWEVENGN